MILIFIYLLCKICHAAKNRNSDEPERGNIMSLKSEYDLHSADPIKTWAQLTLPDNDCPQITKAIEEYTYLPHHLSRNTLYSCMMDAASMAASFFDQNVCPTEQKRKNLTRYARMEESVERNDNSLLFIREQEKFLGYIRVMPITTNQWEDYYDHHKISEAEFIPTQPENLKAGHAHIYIQAIVFPNSNALTLRDKLILQNAAIAGLTGNLLPDTIPEEGINIYFTAFHPYTDKFAKHLKIPPVGKNKHGNTIYGFNISQKALPYSLGHAIYQRWNKGKKPFTHLTQQSPAAPTHPHVHPPQFLHDFSPNES